MERRLMPDSFLVRSWGRVKRPVLSVYLAAFSRLLRAESLQFVDETIDAGYATYRTLARVRVPAESLFPVQVGRGPVPISSTPHFSFVKARLGHEGAGWNKGDWNRYMTHEPASNVAAVAQRQERFERLIEAIMVYQPMCSSWLRSTQVFGNSRLSMVFIEPQLWQPVNRVLECPAAW